MRTALFADDWVAFGHRPSMYESLMEDTLIEARAFHDRATAADWLAVPVDVLTLKDEPAPHYSAPRRVKYWEIIADNLSKAGCSWGCVSADDSIGRTIWLQTHIGTTESASLAREEKLTAFLELESAFPPPTVGLQRLVRPLEWHSPADFLAVCSRLLNALD